MSITRHFRAVPWLDKLVDLLVVILGISIAFGIDNWAEGRKNERTKQRYLANLQSDLRKDSLNLRKNQKDLRELRGAIGKLYTLTDEPNPEEARRIARLLLVFGRGGLFTPESATYQSLLRTGDIGLLQNDSLQITLSKLHDLYEGIEHQQDLFAKIQFDYVVPFYFNYDDRNKVVVDSNVYFQPKFINVLLAVDGNRAMRKGKNESAMEYVNALLAMVEEEQEE